ncbi:MAG: ATP-binding protein [Lachnospiraceae bacterium]|nr:ATP-binding protein [Lachnospiraceae bacterium]
MRSSTKLTLFSTFLILAVLMFQYLMLISEVNNDARSKGIDYSYNFYSIIPIIFLLVMGLIAFFISALIIDRIFNPLRLMISKIKEIGEIHFENPLIIDSGDDEIKEYVTAFNNMSAKISSYIERQKRFISDVSHELATPITVINGHADMLLRRGKSHPELLDSSLKIVKGEILKMDGLVNNLLFLARSDSGKQTYSFEVNDLTELISESAEEIEVIAPEFIIENEVQGDIFALCDAYALKRVLRIILSNAVRYSANSKRIWIKAYESHGLINISIKDDGIGIALEHLPRIFDRFYRVDDSRTKVTGGSGLGLSIAREIITAHGGEITVNCEAGTGCEFMLLLTAAKSNKPSSNLHLPNRTSSSKGC